MTQSFRDIIDLWPSPDALAGEVGSKAETVRKWRQRDSIPAEWWLPVIEAGKARGHALTADTLAALAGRSKAGEAAA
jgi:hypothetical protein